MMGALIAGERDPLVLAGMARAGMRKKIPELREAFEGRFSEHHAFLLARMLAHVDAIQRDIRAVEERIEDLIIPFAEAAARLDADPRRRTGRRPRDHRRDRHRHDPVPHSRAPDLLGQVRPRREGVRRQDQRQRHHRARQPLPGPLLGEAAVGASRTDTFLGERYRRIARRRGKKKAIVAVGRSILIIIWHLLNDPDADFVDLGADHYDQRRGTQRAIRHHIHQLQALGYNVTLQPAA